jgi:hypothetical protein
MMCQQRGINNLVLQLPSSGTVLHVQYMVHKLQAYHVCLIRNSVKLPIASLHGAVVALRSTTLYVSRKLNNATSSTINALAYPMKLSSVIMHIALLNQSTEAKHKIGQAQGKLTAIGSAIDEPAASIR